MCNTTLDGNAKKRLVFDQNIVLTVVAFPSRVVTGTGTRYLVLEYG